MKTAFIALGIILIILGILIAGFFPPLALLGIVVFFIGIVLLFVGVLAIFTSYLFQLALFSPHTLLALHDLGDDEEERNEWISEVLETLRELLELLERAINENWSQQRIIDETRNILLRLLDLIEEHLDEFVEMAGFTGLTGRIIKRLLRSAIRDARNRLRE